jgi:hypothetical protein
MRMRKYLILGLSTLILSGIVLSQGIVVTAPMGGTFSHGARIPIIWVTQGIATGYLRIILKKQGEPDHRVLVPSIAYNATTRLDYKIPEDIPAGTNYFIQVRWRGSQVAGRSGFFSIIAAAQARGIQIRLPSLNQKFALGSPVVIEWDMPSVAVCGSKVNMFAKRISTGEEDRIIDNRSCVRGRNTIDWLINTPSYYSKTGDYRIKIVSETGCTEESETFQILSQDDYDAATTVGSDFNIDTVIFSNGQDLNQGIGINPDTDIRNTFTVNIKWNKSLPAHGGSHSIEVLSVRTSEAIHTSNSPAHFSYEDANASTGIIRVNVPFTIPADKVYAMKRGRFIPLKFKLNLNPPSCDKVARNNTKQFRMRILENVPSADFEVEMVPNTLKVERDKFQKTSVDFEFMVRVRNLSTNDAGGPPAPINNVVCYYRISYPGGGWPGENQTLATITHNWLYHKIRCNSWHVDKNFWHPMTFTFSVDRGKQFLDPNRRNNTVTLEFHVPD